MSLNIVELPYKYYPDPTRNKPVCLGYIYVGEPNTDPEVLINRKVVNMTGSCVCPNEGTEISQPIRTSAGGIAVFKGDPVVLHTAGNYSIKVLNSKMEQVYYDGNAKFNANGSNGDVANFPTLQSAVENKYASAGDAVNLAERTTGNGGGAMWDYVFASGVTVNPFTIVACTGVSTLALKLRVTSTNMPALDLGAVPDTDFNVVPLINYLYDNSEGIKALHFEEGVFNYDENWPYMVTKRAISGVKNRTSFKYVGVNGTAGNLVVGIKLRSSDESALTACSFSGITVNLDGAEYVQGIEVKYYTRQSYLGDVNVENCGIGSEMLVLDKEFYINFGPISLRNSNAFRLGAGLVFRGSEGSSSSINSIEIPDLVIIGFVDGILLDTATSAINTLRIRGSVESCTYAVTYIDGIGINEGIFDLHMEGNTRNVNWIGNSVAGPGRIHWKGVWNGSAGGSIHVGSSSHYFENRFTNTLSMFKFNTAIVGIEGATVADQGGTSGTEDGNAVDYIKIDRAEATPATRQSKQRYINASGGLWLKGASASTTQNTTTFVEFDFTEDIKLSSSIAHVKVSVAYARPDGSFKVYEAMALKRASNTDYSLRFLSGSDVDGTFEVELLGDGTGRVKSGISESIVYSMMIIPF